MNRRRFISVLLTSTVAACLAACQYALGKRAPTAAPATLPPTGTASHTPSPSPSGTPTITASPTASQTHTPSQTASPTATPTATALAVILTGPLDGAELPKLGRVTFAWQPFPDANGYRFETLTPTGIWVTFDTANTQIARYIESLPWAGEYTWHVLALDKNGLELARSVDWRYTKPASPTPISPDASTRPPGGNDGSTDPPDDDGPGADSMSGSDGEG